MTYKTGAVRYRGVYLDGVYTRQMALAIKNEVESILKFFEHTDNALKKSMKVKNAANDLREMQAKKEKNT